MESNEEESVQTRLLDRFRKSWFPPAAIVGALASFIVASFRLRPEPTVGSEPAEPAGSAAGPQESKPPSGMAAGLEQEYAQTAVLGGAASLHPFRRSLNGVAVGAGDRIYGLGDDEVRIFDPGGGFVRAWKVLDKAACLEVAPDGRVYVGALGRVEIYEPEGRRAGGFAVGDKERPAAVTAIKFHGNEILVADAAARIIRRYDRGGSQLGLIGTQHKTGSFMLPNGWLDFDVGPDGVVRATDTGRHRVSAWTLEGSPLGFFGKFGMRDAADFVGCCNPVNLSLTPGGNVVTAEKMVARVKVYDPEGKLLAVIGPEHFDPMCEHIYLAVDSKGRILAADPVRREIKIFTAVARVGENERVASRFFGL